MKYIKGKRYIYSFLSVIKNLFLLMFYFYNEFFFCELSIYIVLYGVLNYNMFLKCFDILMNWVRFYLDFNNSCKSI